MANTIGNARRLIPQHAPSMQRGRSRAVKVAEKRTLRERGLKTPHAIPLAEMAENLLHKRIAAATCPEDLGAELASFGLDSAAQVAACKSLHGLETYLSRRAANGELKTKPTQAFFARAQQEALRSYRLMRHAMALKDPMNLGLRHSSSRLAGSAEQALLDAGVPTYAKPSSLQSNQSTAAYLRHLYRIAMGLDREIGLIQPASGSLRLDARRPDLAGLVLSETNLKQEIPTIDLVNEVLEAGLGDIDVGTSFHPIALPFDEPAAMTRAALAAIGRTSLDDLGAQTARTGFPLRADGHRARDLAGLLGLVGTLDAASGDGSELALLTEDEGGCTQRHVTTLGDLYGAVDHAETCSVAHLRASLDLDFEALVQLLGLYPVRQESGEPVPPSAFAAAFLDDDQPFEIVTVEVAAVGSVKSVHKGGTALDAPELRSLNYLARLHHGTGLAFHHLNWLLAVPGAAAAVETDAAEDRLARRRVTRAGLKVLAGYLRYRDVFGLSPEAYAALFGELSPYWRADVVVAAESGTTAGLEQTEISFLRRLFGDDAPWLHRTVSEALTPVTDPTLAATVRRGLGLSAVELDVIVSAPDADFGLNAGLDERGLGGLYRLATLFRLLGWSPLTGLELLARVDGRLRADLTAKNDSADATERLCSALDQLVELARWMTEAELSAEALLAILTPTAAESVRPSDTDRTWFGNLASAVASALVTAASFRAFETWKSRDSGPIELEGEAWHDHLTEAGLYRPSGVFHPGIDRNGIETACRRCLADEAAAVDLDDEGNLRQLQQLITELERALDGQAQALESQVATLSSNLSAEVAGAFCVWTRSSTLDTLEALLLGPDDTNALVRLGELKRHAAVLDALGIGDIEVLILGTKPEWLGTDEDRASASLVKTLDLEQLYDLQRFTTLHVGPATDAAWFGYLALATEGRPGIDSSAAETTTWRNTTIEAMAVLIGCPAADATTYVDDLFGASAVPDDVRAIDAVARHARLADELHVSATELLALKAVSSSDTGGDWSTAAAAALAALARFKGGIQTPAFRHALAEVKRDALVAAYMQTRIATDSDLRQQVRDREALYSHLLLDVNVTSAVPTSRLVEAMSSLQLYINRALSGLEPGVTFADRRALAMQWQLDKQYRPWEANQKLLLYPQNYIEPELRYLASPEFEELRGAISGDDLNDDTVEAAVNTYMTGLATVCDLSLCSLFVERTRDGVAPANATYHFVARANWERGRFFYRKLDADFKTVTTLANLPDPTQYAKGLDWTYWQEVVVPKTYELFSDVTVCYFLNRYYFLWLEIEETKTQTNQGEIVSWRIHPRYMRCDANALTGAMHTPSLFADGALQSGDDKFTIDGGFRWSGKQPTLHGVYHPMATTYPFSQGVAIAASNNDAGLQNAVLVTFGIDLEDAQGRERQTSLQMRLTDEWSDAIYFWNQSINTQFEDAAPSSFRCVHPIPPSEITAQVDNDLVNDNIPTVRLVPHYRQYWPGARVPHISVSQYHFKVESAKAAFRAAPVGSPTIGTVDVAVDLGNRDYRRSFSTHDSVDPDGYFINLREKHPTQSWISIILEFQTFTNAGGAPPKTFTGEWQGGTTALYKEDLHNEQFDLNYQNFTTHIHDEMIKGTVNLPIDWDIRLQEIAFLTIKAKIKKIYKAIDIEFIVDGKQERLTLEAMDAEENPITEIIETIDIGRLQLRPSDGKISTGWAFDGAHGSRNFIHIMEQSDTPIDKTFLLLNSSPALTMLANSMPRPGGCGTVFTPENQSLPEEMGTFVGDFEKTLDEIYPDPEDTATLDPNRIPSPLFDFDAAYGGYGWEIFYHIPLAIAASYANSGQYDAALAWLAKIFDPSIDQPWRVQPLIDARAPENGLAFDTGEVIVDPDRIATDYPFYYQQAAIRHYLETLLAAGDAAYAGLTQETLQQAKATYVAAKQLFVDTLPDTLEVLTNQPWLDPTLGAAAAERFDGFLPPYNEELRTLYDTIEARLSNLRQWLDIEGEPLNIPLLAAPIDPKVLQKSAKAALTLRSGVDEEENEREPVFDFSTILRSAKGYVENLKTTSSRLQTAITNLDDATMEVVELRIGKDSALRAAAMQELVVAAAEKEVAVAEANLVGASNALAHHVGTILVNYGALAAIAALRTVVVVGRLNIETVLQKTFTLAGNVKAVIPRVFGFSNGGQQFEQADLVSLANIQADRLSRLIKEDKFKAGQKQARDALELAKGTIELTSQVAAATLERDQARAALLVERQSQRDLAIEVREAEEIIQTSNNGFTGTAFYGWLVDDLKLLFAEEWSATQEFCRLLVKLYDAETDEGNGASFIRTTRLGGDYERFNAPHRLALDLERLETAYLRAFMDRSSQTAKVSFALGDLQPPGGGPSVLDALIEHGEAYFELTDEMFDVLYPGQYDRRIESVRIGFPGLARAGLSPHARLTQIANTRYATRERDPKRGGKIKKDRHALQSVVLGAPEVDTATLAAPDGLLKRFQNTGVESRWHLELPTVLELKRGKAGNGRSRAWREAASARYETLKSRLDEVEFEVAFSGRW